MRLGRTPYETFVLVRELLESFDLRETRLLRCSKQEGVDVVVAGLRIDG